MRNHIWQCCYTNLSETSEGVLKTGWQPVSVSEDIPPEALEECIRYQVVNSSIQETMVDEEGNPLNLLEVFGDGQYVYIIRTIYGLTDHAGRPNMFSHAYIISWEEQDVLNHPDYYLRIPQEMFAQDLQHANEKRMPDEPDGLWNVDQIRQELGVSDEGYLQLIRAAYARFYNRSAGSPLYIQYENDDDILKLLFLIYTGLPFYARRQLRSASCKSNSASTDHIVFTKGDAKKQSFYLIPQTGENSILDERTTMWVKQLEYLDYAISSFCSLDEINSYYLSLENEAREFGNTDANDDAILQIAHKIITGIKNSDMTDDALKDRARDMLRTDTKGNYRAEVYIAELLHEINARSLSLGNAAEERLKERLGVSNNEALADESEVYFIQQLRKKSVDEAVQILKTIPDESVSRYERRLANDDSGRVILDQFLCELQTDSDVSWKVLYEILSRSELIHGKRKRTIEKLQANAQTIVTEAFKSKKGEEEAYDEYCDFIVRLRSEGVDGEKSSKRIQELFWKYQSINEIQQDRYSLYKSFNYPGSNGDRYLKICGALGSLSKGNEEEFILSASELIDELEQNPGEEAVQATQLFEYHCKMVGMELLSWFLCACDPKLRHHRIPMIRIRRSIRDRNWTDVADEIWLLLERDARDVDNASSYATLGRQIESECLAFEKVNGEDTRKVPFDLWLVLGKLIHKNPFSIFNEIQPDALKMSATELIQTSKFFKYERVNAEDYVRQKGVMSREVKRMLQELKSEERHIIRDERDVEDKTSDQEHRSGLFDLFKRRRN